VDELNFLRPTSVKGVWRWFARALVAGALYDLGLLCGEPGDDVVKRPTAQEINTISRIVGNEMGLGYAGGRGKGTASRFRLRVEVVRRPRVESTGGPSITVRGRQVRLQRLALLTLGRKSVRYFEGGTFRLVVERVPGSSKEDRKGEELALRALLLALSISGVGKASRKGLGSLDVVRVGGLTVGKNLRSLLDEAYELAQEVVGRHAELKPREGRGLPPVPSVAKNQVAGVQPFSLYRVEGVNWVDLHNFFVRSERSRKLTGSSSFQDPLRAALEAWILGLPRSQKGTGYFIGGRAERRASPIFVAYHGARHIFGGGAYISVFASADWPAKLKWVGAGSQQLTVDEKLIAKALGDALGELWKYLGASPSGVWP
ncbi:MAG: RAMP superfamily CRISPR-associated protein, partial [Desulfurococcaceae archaeon]